jgi:hypothetical protein
MGKNLIKKVEEKANSIYRLSSFTSEHLTKEGILNYNYVEKIINEHLGFKKDYGNHIWSLIVFEMWYERYG